MRRRTLWDLRRPGVEAALPTIGQRRICGVRQDRDPTDLGDGLLEQLQPFAESFHADAVGQPRDVAARPREARDESEPAGIAHDRHDDRDRRGGVLGCRRCRRRPRYDDVHLETNQLGREFGQPVESTIGKSIVDDDILALNPPEFAQPLPERLNEMVLIRG